MTETIYSVDNLPATNPGTNGWAMPRPDAKVVTCEVPVKTKMSTPWGQELEGIPGVHWHIAQDNKGDHYPNDEFDDFYETEEKLTAEDDPRAAFLIDFWKAKGHHVDVYLAAKTKPALVVGVLTDSGKFYSKNDNGTGVFNAGDLLLQSPYDPNKMWVIQAEKFTKKYDDEGIRQGTPPAELLKKS